MQNMLQLVKTALRLSTDGYDDELTMLIKAALEDLGIAGVSDGVTVDAPIIQRAVVTYCKANFGSPGNYDKLKASYDEQKAQLRTATGYTDWGDEA